MAMKLYSLFIGLVSLGVLIYIYAFPPESMKVSREGVPHFTPKVVHPETGEPIDINDLVRHYKGD